MKPLLGRPGHQWSVVEDSDGHRWLITPGQRLIASFTAETSVAQMMQVIRSLNKLPIHITEIDRDE